jgi:predicted permease
MRLWKRLTHWRSRRRFEADLADEIRIHREMAEEYEAGRSRDFGSVALTLEDSRAVWRFAWVESLMQDLRYAIRGVRKSPGFALAVVGTIGAALGLNTTVFTVVNAYALRPAPVLNPESLYQFSWTAGNRGAFTAAEYQNLREHGAPFREVFAYRNFLGSIDGRPMPGEPVSDNYFTMLGAGIHEGRPLQAGDTNALVLSYDAWQNKFGGAPGIVGRKVYLRGQPFEVVGITARSFVGLESIPISFWIPMSTAPSVTEVGDRFWVIGRLLPGTTPQAAQAPLLAWARAITANLPREDRATSIKLEQRSTAVPLSREALATFIPLFVAFGLVLLTACANVSNIMLARALARQREIGIRISLGAGRARLVRQLLTESVLLALPAAAAGFAISQFTLRGAQRLMFATVPAAFAHLIGVADLSPDWRVFGFILAAAVAATLFFGLIPAVQTTRSSLVQANRGDFANDPRPQRLRSALVVAQVAVCALLLVFTVVVVRAQQRATAVDVGLDLRGVYDVRMASKLQAAAAERLAREPGVEAVASAWRAPLYGSLRRVVVTPAGGKQTYGIGGNFVTPDYFAVFRIPLVKGRLFTPQECAADAAVAVISETTARRLWPGRDPLGETLAIAPRRIDDRYFERVPAYPSARVIGVVRDVNAGMIANGVDTDTLYFPNTARFPHNDSLLVRIAGDQAGARRRLESALTDVAPSLADAINPMDDVLALQIYPFRVVFWIAGFLGCFALVLTVSGIYGVMSYLVSQRTKEIGIRVAMGARAADVIGMVMKQSVRVAAIGAFIGIGLALSVAPLLAHQVELVDPYDAVAYGGGAIIVVLATVAASWQPVRKAIAVDPVTALKCD